MWLARIFVLLGMVVVLGCGPGSEATGGADAEVAGLVGTVKAVLEDIAETGELGEGFGEARGMVDELKERGTEVGTKLSADLEALGALTSKEEIKAKAKEIADGL